MVASGTKLIRNTVVVGIFLTATLSVVVWHRGTEIQRHKITSFTPGSPTYVGTERCAGCHVQETDGWRYSHHAQAMQPANATTVLGDFRNRQFAKDGLTS